MLSRDGEIGWILKKKLSIYFLHFSFFYHMNK